MRPAIPGGRRAVTAVELLVAAALLGLLGTVLASLGSGARRQGRQVEELSNLQATAVLLQAALTRDLDGALALRYLDPAEVTPGEDRAELVLAAARTYDAAARPAIRATRVRYRLDAAGGQLRRDGRPVGPGGLTAASFRWEPGDSTALVVTLTGDPTSVVGAAGASGRVMTLRFPAPAGTDGAGGWRFSPAHEGAAISGG